MTQRLSTTRPRTKDASLFVPNCAVGIGPRNFISPICVPDVFAVGCHRKIFQPIIGLIAIFMIYGHFMGQTVNDAILKANEGISHQSVDVPHVDFTVLRKNDLKVAVYAIQDRLQDAHGSSLITGNPANVSLIADLVFRKVANPAPFFHKLNFTIGEAAKRR